LDPRIHGNGRREAQRNTQSYGVPRVLTCITDPAGPKGACDGRDDAAADRALGDGEHQRNQRKNRRDAGKSIHSQSRYKIDFEQSDKDLDDHDGGIGYCKPQDHGRDWPLDQHVSAGVEVTGLAASLPVRSLVLAAFDRGRGNSRKSDGSIARFPAAPIG
jgi:hypothetical protein